MPGKILIIDDTPANMSVLVDVLEPQGYTVSAAPDGVIGLNVAVKLVPDVILLDVMMPELDGLETCRRLKKNVVTASIPVLFISAKDDQKSILEGFRAGGADYIVKPFRPEEVLARVEAHLRLNSLTAELKQKNLDLVRSNQELEKEMARRLKTEDALSTADAKLIQLADNENRKWGIERFIGKSQALTDVIDSIRRLHTFSSVHVLITGESGTGKELVARAIHHGGSGPRQRGPFVSVNCVAIPDELAESSLFGHLKGAFAGAVMDRKGYFELADNGTLFLDEIGEMSPALQAKVLRVLEDGHVTPIGSDAPRKVNVRVLAATNTNLQEQLAAGTFRRDLYFRLAQFSIHVPSLRERSRDIPLLADHFLKIFASEMCLKAPRMSRDTYESLAAHGFPGNVRELKNIIERSLIESGGMEIFPGHLKIDAPLMPPAMEITTASTSAAKVGISDALPLNLEKAENILIQRALAETNGNIAKAARLLGINRTRIYRKFPEAPQTAITVETSS